MYKDSSNCDYTWLGRFQHFNLKANESDRSFLELELAVAKQWAEGTYYAVFILKLFGGMNGKFMKNQETRKVVTKGKSKNFMLIY